MARAMAAARRTGAGLARAGWAQARGSTPFAHAAGRAAFSSGLTTEQQEMIRKLAEERQTSVSLLQLYKFGLLASRQDDDSSQTLLQAASFLHRELPIR